MSSIFEFFGIAYREFKFVKLTWKLSVDRYEVCGLDTFLDKQDCLFVKVLVRYFHRKSLILNNHNNFFRMLASQSSPQFAFNFYPIYWPFSNDSKRNLKQFNSSSNDSSSTVGSDSV